MSSCGCPRDSFRYYDQGVGRFTQMDEWLGKSCTPITLNKYMYTHGDPVNFTDPSGYFIGFGLVDVGMSQFIQVWGNTHKAKKRYDTYQSIRRTLCRTGKSIGSYIDKTTHLHHAKPKYMGGPDISDNLVELADTLHRRLHQLVNILYGLNGLKAYNATSYGKLSPSDRKYALKILYETMKAFDASCSSVKGYKPIAPTLKKFL